MIEQIIHQNIWWQDKGLIEQDPKLVDLGKKKLQWRPAILGELDLFKSAIYTLRGPRQIGKTTSLKIMIRDLLARPDIHKEQVMYYSCDNIDTYKELIELLETYLNYTQKLAIPSGKHFIFLDEITAIPDWQKGIKYLVDQGSLAGALMILTGSNAKDLRRGVERLPGRRGPAESPDRVMLPMRFAEFVRLLRPDLADRVPQNVDPFDLKPEGFRDLLALRPFGKDLSLLFDQYLTTGGFITAINAYFSEREIGYAVYETYQQWLRGDIARSGRSERTARQIIRELVKMSSSAFGWDTIAKKIDVASHKTISEYMEELEDLFALKILFQVDVHTGTPKVKKMKKAYFIDSFLYWTFLGWVENWMAYPQNVKSRLVNAELKSRLVEQVVANELFYRVDQRDWLNSNVFFWKNSGEIDFIVLRERNMIPVEVKYQKGADFSDFKVIHKLGFKRGLLVTADQMDLRDDFVMLPVEMFLLAGSS